MMMSFKSFFRRTVACGFLNATNAPTKEAKQALPDDLEWSYTSSARKGGSVFP